jgi:hypothetical protein
LEAYWIYADKKPQENNEEIGQSRFLKTGLAG